MKLKPIICSVILLICGLSLSAQSQKKYDHVVKLNIPSYIYYCYPPFDVPRSFEATSTSQYYYNEDDIKILDGPVKIAGGYTKPAVRTPANSFGEYSSSITITANIVNGVVEGAWNGTYKESQKSGKNTLTYDLSLKTTFVGGKMSGSLLMSSNLKRNGKDYKSLWDYKMDEHSNIKSINYALGDRTCKVTFDEEGKATGTYAAKGVSFNIHKNVVLGYFNRKTGETCECEEEQNELLTRYTKGECTLDDIMKAGYVLEKYQDVTFTIDSYAIRCLVLGESEFGEFAEVSFPVYMLTKADIATLEDLIALIKPEENVYPIDWNPKYDEVTGILKYNHGWYQGVEQYVAPSVAKEFLHLADSISKAECIELSKLVCTNASNQVAANAFPGVVLNREVFWFIDDDAYNKMLTSGKNTYTIKEIRPNTDDYGYIITGTLDAKAGDANGPVSLEVTTYVCTANLGKAFSVKLLNAVNIPTCWDTYREKKASIMKTLKTIGSDPSEYDKESYTNLRAFYKNYDMDAKESYEESMNALTYLEGIVDDFKKFGSARKQVMQQNDELAAKLNRHPDVMSSYNAQFSSLDLAWAPYKDHNKLNEALEMITRTEQFAAKRDEVKTNDAQIQAVKANGEKIYAAYSTFMSNSDITLPGDANTNKLDNIINIQKETYAILSDASIKDIEKKVKKAKLTDINDIIQFVNQNFTPADSITEVESKGEIIVESEDEIKVDSETETPEVQIKKEISKPAKTVKPDTEKQESGYGQYVDVAGLMHFNNLASGLSGSINYIGGYRFNKNIFLGLGIGINVNDDNGNINWSTIYKQGGDNTICYDIQYLPHSFISIPLYLNFRVDFGKMQKSWNPYMSLSAGYHMSIAPIGSALPGDFWTLWDQIQSFDEYKSIVHTTNSGIMADINFGINHKLNKNLGLYYGLGFKVETRKEVFDIEYTTNHGDGGAGGSGAATVLGAKLSVGLSF